jgi:hypothetical protein
MKVYVQFYDKKLNGELDESMGSDGVYHLDQRQTIDTQIATARLRAKTLKSVQPNYVSFKIMKGERYSTAKPLTDLISIERENSVDFIVRD